MSALNLLYDMGITFITTSGAVVDFLSTPHTIGSTEFTVLALMFGIGIPTILGLIIVKSVIS